MATQLTITKGAVSDVAVTVNETEVLVSSQQNILVEVTPVARQEINIDHGMIGPQGPQGQTGAQGPQGATGAAATIAVGATTTGAAGTPAAVTNTGTSSAAVFNFTIPQGIKGDTGNTGPKGDTGATGAGVATGGTTGQVLVKASNTNYDTTWTAIPVTSVNGQTGAVSLGYADLAGAIPTWNQNTTGTAANVTGVVAIANGGTGAITAPLALTALGAYPASNPSGYTSNTGTVTSVAATAGTGISVTGSPITSSGTLNITNTAPDQTVAIASGTGISVTGTYPNFTVTNTSPSSGGTVTSVTGTAPVVSSGGTTPAISMAAATASVNGYLTSTDWNTFNNKGSVTSVSASAGTGISITGSPITSSGTLNITNTAPDQTVVLTAGTGISTSGTYPNFTITNTSPSSGGTVTSVATGTGLTGGPITGTGTIAIDATVATLTGTQILSNKRIDPRVVTAATATSLTPSIATADVYAYTALASALTINAPTGTPLDGNKLIFRLLDNGTARALTWDATYTVVGTVLPTTTVINKTTYVGCMYNTNNTRWDVIAVTTQA